MGAFSTSRQPIVLKFILFCLVMLGLAWLLYGIFKGSWSSINSVLMPVELIPWMIFMFWVRVARPFSLWERWVAPAFVLAFSVIIWVRAEAYVRPLIHSPIEHSLKMFALWYLIFYAVVGGWIVAIPIEEAALKLGIATHVGRVAARLGFALAAVLFISVAGVFIWPIVLSPTQSGQTQLISICHDLVYLAIGFYILLMARLAASLAWVGRGQRSCPARRAPT